MTESAVDTRSGRYGPVSFLVALVHILVVDLIAWIFFPLFILLIVALPILVVYLVVAAFIVKRPGNIGQVGRGMLIGSLSGPLSLAIYVPVCILVFWISQHL